MACLERESPALKEILLKLYRAERPVEIDHHLYEFGSVEYHIQCSAADPNRNYLSISTPLLSQGLLLSSGLSPYTIQKVKEVCSDAVEIVEPAKEGYQLTLKLNFAKIPHGKDSEKVIKRISSVQAVILGSQLKEMLQNVNSENMPHGMHKPLKLIYHPREPFYVIRQNFQYATIYLEKLSEFCIKSQAYKEPFRFWKNFPQKITAVFPMRFKEHADVIIATAFFQELMDVGSSEKWAKAPPCTWSPIPPPELRGESLEDLSTNGGFVSFEISSRHIEGRKVDKIVWSLLNFYAHVKSHVKCTRGFIQRQMQKRLEALVKLLQKATLKEDEDVKNIKANARFRYVRKLVNLSKPKIPKQRCAGFARKIKRIRFRIKIRGFGRFHRKLLSISKCSSAMGYNKLE